MPILFACPCGKRLRFKEDLAGKRSKCPGCGHAFLVPAASEPAELIGHSKENEDEPSGNKVGTLKKRKKKRRLWWPRGGFSMPALFGRSRILGFKPGCLLLTVALVGAAFIAAYLTVPGMGRRTYYLVAPIRDDPFTAPSGIRVTIYNTEVGTIEDELMTGRVSTDPESGIKTVFYKSHASKSASKTVGDTTATYEIYWTIEEGLARVTCNGKNVPRSIFAAGEAYHAVRTK